MTLGSGMGNIWGCVCDIKVDLTYWLVDGYDLIAPVGLCADGSFCVLRKPWVEVPGGSGGFGLFSSWGAIASATKLQISQWNLWWLVFPCSKLLVPVGPACHCMMVQKYWAKNESKYEMTNILYYPSQWRKKGWWVGDNSNEPDFLHQKSLLLSKGKFVQKKEFFI